MKIKHSKSYYVYQVFNTIILTLVTLSCIFPMIWMLYSYVKRKRHFNADIVGCPKTRL